MPPTTIRANRMWQTTPLDHAIAEEFFGWRWLAYQGRPVRSHPEYPKEMRVRRFYPPDTELAKSKSNKQAWKEHFVECPHEPAKGDEPLCYCYESSMGPHMVPHFSGHAEAIAKLERELVKRKLFDRYQKILAVCIGSSVPGDLATAECEDKCIAALATVRSKHIDLNAFDESMAEHART